MKLIGKVSSSVLWTSISMSCLPKAVVFLREGGGVGNNAFC